MAVVDARSRPGVNSKLNVSAQDYSQLLPDTQLLLIAMAALEPTSGPYGTALHRCKQVAELPDAAFAAVVDELSTNRLGEVRFIENVGTVVALTDLGRAAVKQLALVTPGGPVEELSTNLSKIQRAILDAVVSSHLRNRNPPSTSHVRALTRRALDPQPTTADVGLEIETLLRDHLVASAGADPPLWLKLPGVLESSWGRNALDLFEHILGVIGEEDPGAPQLSFGMLLKRGVSPRVFGLVCLLIPLTKLSHGPYDHNGDQWWAMPPDRDLLLERGSALQILGEILRAAESKPSNATPSQTAVVESEIPPLSTEPVVSLLQSTFISYGGPDEAFARKLNDALEKRGVRTFFFKDDAAPGERLHRLMRKGVNDHDRTILICSESSLQRPGLLNELEETLARESRDGGQTYLIPIRLDDYVISGWKPRDPDVARAVRDRVIADFREHENPSRFEAQLLRLVAVLEAPEKAAITEAE